ncbi:MAG: hypothetical protein PUD63_03835, partial [Clostridia bacterium]|nr:hypothetical protein [Clostridia bacterium]
GVQLVLAIKVFCEQLRCDQGKRKSERARWHGVSASHANGLFAIERIAQARRNLPHETGTKPTVIKRKL